MITRFALPPILVIVALLLVGLVLWGFERLSLPVPILPAAAPLTGMTSHVAPPLSIAPTTNSGVVAVPTLPPPTPVYQFSHDEKNYLIKVNIWGMSLDAATRGFDARNRIGSYLKLQNCIDTIAREDKSIVVPSTFAAADAQLRQGLSKASDGLRTELDFGGDVNNDTQTGVSMVSDSLKEAIHAAKALRGLE